MNSELIRNLHNAMYFLNIEGHGMSADHVKEAIAALSRPVKPECVKHNYEFCKGSVAGFISHYRGERPDCPYCKVEPDKPEPLPDIPPELEGFISRNACGAGELSKYCYVISVDDFRYYIAKLTAALSAKPEVLPEVPAAEDVVAVDKALPVGSEEDMRDWLQYNHRYERDGRSTKYTKVFDYKRVEYYLQEVAAAHKAELAEKSEEVESYKAAFSLADDKWQECIAKLEEAEAKGRREALAYDPPIPAELEKYKALADAVDHELVVSLESTLDSYDSPKEAINRLLAWAEQVALDPSVSRDAQALIEQGRREALENPLTLEEALNIAAAHARGEE